MINKQVSLEETKSNGFFPQTHHTKRIGGNHGGDDSDFYEMDKPEDELILEGKIDPLDWKKEIERVENEMDNIEKDLELIRTRGKNDLTEDFEECRRHIELIIELCKDIQQSCHSDVRKIFAKAVEVLENELTFIRKNEIRINQNNATAILKLNSIT